MSNENKVMGIGWEVLNELYIKANGVERFRHKDVNTPDEDKTPPQFSIRFVADLFEVSRTFVYKVINDPEAGVEVISSGRTKKMTPRGIAQFRKFLNQKHPDKYNFNRLNKCLVLNILNFKGGIGKTSLTITLAHAIALRWGLSICVVDTDAQASLTAMNSINGDEEIDLFGTSYSMMTPIRDDMDEMAVENSVLTTNWENIDIIPANLGLYNIEFELAAHQAENPEFEFWNMMNTHLDKLRPHYDIILIDSPPSLGFVSLNSVYASDALLVPITPSQIAFQSIVSFFKMLSETMFSINEALVRNGFPEKEFDFIRIVNNMYEDNQNSRLVAIELQKAFGEFLMYTEVLRSKAIEDATSEYKTVYERSDTKNRETYNRCMTSVNSFADEVAEAIFSVRHRLPNGQGQEELDV